MTPIEHVGAQVTKSTKIPALIGIAGILAMVANLNAPTAATIAEVTGLTSLNTFLVIGCVIIAALGTVYLRSQAQSNPQVGASAVDPELLAALMSGASPEGAGSLERISREPVADEPEHHAALRAEFEQIMQRFGMRTGAPSSREQQPTGEPAMA
ncbi:hypothetical protein CL628_04475 [bacterium]|nr:hypothetical protein [bacterium]